MVGAQLGSKLLRSSAWLAIAFGGSLAVLEVARNWGDWQWWPFWIVDYLAASFLLVGGSTFLRAQTTAWLGAGWGFTCALFWTSFFNHLDNVRREVITESNEGPLTLIIGVMLGITIAGLTATLIGAPRKDASRLMTTPDSARP